MMLSISAKMQRDKQVINDITVEIDHVSGNFFITKEDVLAHLNELLPNNGAEIQVQDLKQLEANLSNIPQVKNSDVFVNNLGELAIDVQQRQPLYRVIRPNMVSYYVDAEGYKFPVSKKYTAQVPIASGNISDNGRTSGLIDSELNTNLKTVVEYILADEFLKAQFGHLHVNAKGELELIPRVGKHVVLIGNADDIDKKMKRVKIFYYEGLTKTGFNAYKVINVKFKDQIVCSK